MINRLCYFNSVIPREFDHFPTLLNNIGIVVTTITIYSKDTRMEGHHCHLAFQWFP